MAKLFPFNKKAIACPPGTLMHIGEERTELVEINSIFYGETIFEEQRIENIEEYSFKEYEGVNWINITGIHDLKILETIGKKFNLHSLLLEDITNTGQRPKIEDYTDYLFVVLKIFNLNETNQKLEIEQFSLIIGKNYVISFQEKKGDILDPIRNRIKNMKGRIRKGGADYLAYALIDLVVDNYFVILENIGEKIEDIEEELVINPNPTTLKTIHALKKDLILLRKAIWPQRELINGLQRGESQLIRESTGIYLRNLYDHTIQIIDTVESFRDMVSGMLDIYLSSISNKMNEIMKVLTIIATIFIPLTFIVGLYGMNFEYMPELLWNWGYPLILFLMLGLGILMIVYFRRKKWI